IAPPTRIKASLNLLVLESGSSLFSLAFAGGGETWLTSHSRPSSIICCFVRFVQPVFIKNDEEFV
ncbi:MAG: hypothetical protein PHX81_10485, partial [Eubacteriales bacterium]|nr:hypothetical protein [Eubacteriales bacterium]